MPTEIDMVIPVGVLKERDLVVLRADIAAVCAARTGRSRVRR